MVECREIAEGLWGAAAPAALGVLLEDMAYSRTAPFFLDDEHVDRKRLDYFRSVMAQEHEQGRPVRLFHFREATIFGQGGVILADGSLLRDSAAEFLNNGLTPDGMSGPPEMPTLQAAPERLPGVSVLVKRPWYRNFGHYVVDLLPVLPMLKSVGVEVETILYGDVSHGPLRDIMTACAQRFYPDANVVFIDDAATLTVQHLLYVEPVHVPPLFKHPLALAQARETSIDLCPPAEEVPEQRKRIYISRQKVGSRRIANGAELESLLESEGFTTLFPEQVGFGEQIAAFRNADIVIGAKGAAFVNTIFCRAGTHVLLLSPPGFVDPFFWGLTPASGFRYSEIFCKAVGEGSAAAADFEVDIAKIGSFLSRVRAAAP